MDVMECSNYLDAIYIMCVFLGVCVCPQMTERGGREGKIEKKKGREGEGR